MASDPGNSNPPAEVHPAASLATHYGAEIDMAAGTVALRRQVGVTGLPETWGGIPIPIIKRLMAEILAREAAGAVQAGGSILAGNLGAPGGGRRL